MQSEGDILALIRDDPWMMDVLKMVRQRQLPGSWGGAGFIRRKIWDTLHGFEEPTPLNDIDILLFDPSNHREERRPLNTT